MELTITPNFAQERALNMLRRDWKANDASWFTRQQVAVKRVWQPS